MKLINHDIHMAVTMNITSRTFHEYTFICMYVYTKHAGAVDRNGLLI